MSTIIHRVLSASASLAEALQTPAWQGWIDAIFRTGLQLIGPGATLIHLHGGPFLVSPFSLRIAGSLAQYPQQGRVVAGTAVLKQGPGIAIGGHLRLSLASTRSYHSPPSPGVAARPRGAVEWSTRKAWGVVQSVAVRTYLTPPRRRE